MIEEEKDGRMDLKEYYCPEPSKRELEVVNLVKEGYSNKEIGCRLEIGEQTVKNHITVLLIRLRARNRAHIVYLCMKKGLIE